MNRSRTIVFCILGVLAVSLVGMASAASAFTPERGKCTTAKKGKGEYLNNLCTEPGEKGGSGMEFVWEPQSKATAFTESTGELTLKAYTPEGAELSPITCTRSKGNGKQLTATTSESTVTLEGCKGLGVGNENCSGGANHTKTKSGEIKTYTLDGKLGTISSFGGVGEVISGEGPGGLIAEFKCGANEVAWAGALIGELTPVDAKAAATSVLSFAASGSSQEFEEIDGEPNVHLAMEINGLGGQTFPFKVVDISRQTDKGTSYEIRG
jgi:hypothetical protein